MAPEPSPASPAGQHVLLGLRFQELSWDHTSPEEEESVLWLEFDGDNEGTPVNKLLKVYSKQVAGCRLHWCGWGGEAGLRGPQPVGGSGLAGKGVPWLLGAWAPGERAPPGLEPPRGLTGPGLGHCPHQAVAVGCGLPGAMRPPHTSSLRSWLLSGEGRAWEG